MHQTVTSFGTNLTNSFTSQSPKNRLRFNQKVSFFEEKMSVTRTKDFYSSKEQLRDYILNKQDVSNFIDYHEFQQSTRGEVCVSILSHFNNTFKSTGWDESQEEFNSKVEALVEAVKRRYPFIKLYRKVATHHQQDSFLQIQMCTNYDDRKCYVLYQQDVFEHTARPRTLVDAISLFIKKFNLVVTVDCEQKDLIPIGKDHNHANKLLEGLRVTIRQKEEGNQVLSPTKQIVIKSQICTLSASRTSNTKADLFRTNENINLEKQVRVYFSPTKTQNWMTLTNQADVVHKNYKSSGKKQEQIKLPVKLFSQTVMTNYFEQATFLDLSQQIKHYEIEIVGENLKPSKTLINVDELMLSKDEQLMVSIRVERSDIAKCSLKVTKEGQPIRDAVIKVSSGGAEGYELIQDFNLQDETFFFWGQVGTMYKLEIQKMDCFPQKKEIQILADHVVDIELVGCVQTQLKFRSYNVTDNQALENVQLEIVQPEDPDKEAMKGVTDEKGFFSCMGLMFKQLHLKARRKGFLSVSFDYDVRANSTGTMLSIPMLPDYYSLINQYHVIVYVPQRSDFQMDFQLKAPDGVYIDERTKTHPKYKAKLEVMTLKKKSKLYNFQVHVQCLDPFMRTNQYQFIVHNQKNSRVPLCQNTNTQSPRPPKSISEMFLTTRVSLNTFVHSPPKKQNDVVTQKIVEYCAEDSVRVFVTFGHEIINTFMIQTNILSTQEKCFGIIDLDKRKFYYCEDDMVTQDHQKSIKSLKLKQQPQQVQSCDNLGQILSLITNQKLKVR